jgi:hypothetical protein
MYRLVSSLLMAVALLVAPLAMLGGGHAMAQATPAETGAAASHCSDQGDRHGATSEQLPGMSASCAIACLTIIGSAPRVADAAPVVLQRPVAFAPAPLHGINPEGESPPPRIHPEI